MATGAETGTDLGTVMVKSTLRGAAEKSAPRIATPLSKLLISSDRFESELEIVDEIAQIFDADGNSNERISDAERVAFFFRHGSVRHERGMINQAFDAAQTFRE